MEGSRNAPDAVTTTTSTLVGHEQQLQSRETNEQKNQKG